MNATATPPTTQTNRRVASKPTRFRPHLVQNLSSVLTCIALGLAPGVFAQLTGSYNFNDCQVPGATAIYGIAAVADDGGGNNCVLHLTDINQSFAYGAFFIPNPAGRQTVDRLHVTWRSFIGGDDGSVCTTTQFPPLNMRPRRCSTRAHLIRWS